jgi:hypothetical protein
MISTRVERAQKTTEKEPRIKTCGHLALLEWDEKALAAMTAPTRKSVMDRCYDGGVLVLIAAIIAAIAASLGQF